MALEILLTTMYNLILQKFWPHHIFYLSLFRAPHEM